MSSGALVPDDVMVGLICGELQGSNASAVAVRRGWLLDGFPRTKTQAEALQNLFKVNILCTLLNT